ncbi:hypothetical protein [Paraburkholderia caballeronis]|nr:hypothetical protein [Paraburkholderia caballeronis]
MMFDSSWMAARFAHRDERCEPRVDIHDGIDANGIRLCALVSGVQVS